MSSDTTLVGEQRSLSFMRESQKGGTSLTSANNDVVSFVNNEKNVSSSTPSSISVIHDDLTIPGDDLAILPEDKRTDLSTPINTQPSYSTSISDEIVDSPQVDSNANSTAPYFAKTLDPRVRASIILGLVRDYCVSAKDSAAASKRNHLHQAQEAQRDFEESKKQSRKMCSQFGFVVSDYVDSMRDAEERKAVQLSENLLEQKGISLDQLDPESYSSKLWESYQFLKAYEAGEEGQDPSVQATIEAMKEGCKEIFQRDDDVIEANSKEYSRTEPIYQLIHERINNSRTVMKDQDKLAKEQEEFEKDWETLSTFLEGLEI